MYCPGLSAGIPEKTKPWIMPSSLWYYAAGQIFTLLKISSGPYFRLWRCSWPFSKTGLPGFPVLTGTQFLRSPRHAVCLPPSELPLSFFPALHSFRGPPFSSASHCPALLPCLLTSDSFLLFFFQCDKLFGAALETFANLMSTYLPSGPGLSHPQHSPNILFQPHLRPPPSLSLRCSLLSFSSSGVFACLM